MPNNPELEKIIERVRKLQAKADSCREIGSEAEAEAFAAAVQKTLALHKLSMSDLECDEQDKNEPVGQHDLQFAEQKAVMWRGVLANTVARAHFCSVFTYSGSSRIALVGRASDRKVAEYVFHTLLDYANKAEAASARVHGGRGHRANFMLGFAQRVAQRYQAEAAALRAEVAATGTSLVRLDTATAAVQSYLSGIRLSKTPVRMQHHAAAYAAGSQAGSRARIRSNGVEGASPAAGALAGGA